MTHQVIDPAEKRAHLLVNLLPSILCSDYGYNYHHISVMIAQLSHLVPDPPHPLLPVSPQVDHHFQAAQAKSV